MRQVAGGVVLICRVGSGAECVVETRLQLKTLGLVLLVCSLRTLREVDDYWGVCQYVSFPTHLNGFRLNLVLLEVYTKSCMADLYCHSICTTLYGVQIELLKQPIFSVFRFRKRPIATSETFIEKHF